MATIITKNNGTASSVPTGAQLTAGELAVNTADKRLFTKNGGGTVVELGTNPSSLTLPNGTANGVPYLNASKQLVTGSALTFDGTRFTVRGGNGDSLRVDNNGSQYTELDFANNGTIKSSFYWDNTNSNLYLGSTGQFSFATGGGSPYVWSIGSEQMRLTSTGLGIGTSSPTTKLTIGSGGTGGIASGGLGAFLSQGATVNFYEAFDGTKSFIAGTDSSQSFAKVGTLSNHPVRLVANNGTGYAHLDTSGNLGLGVTPSAWGSSTKSLSIGASGAAFIEGRTDAFRLNIGLNAYDTGTDAWKYVVGLAASLYKQIDGQHQWFNAPSGTADTAIPFTQTMTLDSSGNLLVGTTSAGNYAGPSIMLMKQPANETFIRVNHDSSASNGGWFMGFSYDSSAIGSITQSGTTAVLYNVTSDQRLKENIVDAPEFGSVIDSMKVRSYDWKSDGNHQRAGFIAQELVAVAPEAVHQPEDPEEMMAVDYSKLVPMLVKEIQSLRKRLAAAGIA